MIDHSGCWQNTRGPGRRVKRTEFKEKVIYIGAGKAERTTKG